MDVEGEFYIPCEASDPDARIRDISLRFDPAACRNPDGNDYIKLSLPGLKRPLDLFSLVENGEFCAHKALLACFTYKGGAIYEDVVAMC